LEPAIEERIEAERLRESRQLIERLSQQGGLDLEAMEFFVRSQVLAMGAKALEQFLGARLSHEKPPVCASKHLPCAMRLHERRKKTIRTILGEVSYERGRYVCPCCDAVRYPADELLGVAGTGFSPGARRMMAHAGAFAPFGQGAQILDLFASVRVDPKDIERIAHSVGESVERWMGDQAAQAVGLAGCGAPLLEDPPQTLYVCFDATGTPVRRSELQGVKGRQGEPKTRETKLGCVFTQSTLDDKGRPVRDEASTSYVGAIESSSEFGYRIHGEAVRRGLHQAQRVVIIADALAYNKSIVAEHFPKATFIIDLYHAREHLAAFARALGIGLDTSWYRAARRILDKGQIDRLIQHMRERLPRSGPRRAEGLKQIAYCENNAEHMRYGRYRRQKLFVGSGVIEAGCRTVVGVRLKGSGMRWSVPGANAILALRCAILSRRFEDYYEDAA